MTPPSRPRLPLDSRSQAAGRQGEAAVTERLEGHGWVVLQNRPNPDFGVDLAAFKRAEDRSVLPYAVSIQVKSVQQPQRLKVGGVSVRVRSSTLTSWLWSNTPTVCIVYDPTTEQMWWSPPVASPSAAARSTTSRTLRLTMELNSYTDWLRLDNAIIALWTHHAGAGAIMDLPLILQLLTDIALGTDLWSTVGDSLADPVYHAAAVYAYRTVAGLNGLAGRTGSDDFVELAERAAHQVGVSWSHRLVNRQGARLGVVSGIELSPWQTFLAEVFGQSGRELAQSLPRLQQLARMPELGVPTDIGSMLTGITHHQLAVIDPDSAKTLSPEDFAQLAERPYHEFPARPEFDNQVPRPLARPMLRWPLGGSL